MGEGDSPGTTTAGFVLVVGLGDRTDLWLGLMQERVKKIPLIKHGNPSLTYLITI